eukprot:5687381-Prymnesium_polylepis.1
MRGKAEGAIEGALEDYRMEHDFATKFRYSRFDSVAAGARNASALGGRVASGHAHKHPGREIG